MLWEAFSNITLTHSIYIYIYNICFLNKFRVVDWFGFYFNILEFEFNKKLNFFDKLLIMILMIVVKIWYKKCSFYLLNCPLNSSIQTLNWKKNREERQLFFRLILMFDFISAHVREKWDYCRMLAKKDEKCEVSKFWICTED